MEILLLCVFLIALSPFFQQEDVKLEPIEQTEEDDIMAIHKPKTGHKGKTGHKSKPKPNKTKK